MTKMVRDDSVAKNVRKKSCQLRVLEILHGLGDTEFKDVHDPQWDRSATRFLLQFISWTSTPIANMVRDDFVAKNVEKKSCQLRVIQILHGSRVMELFPKKKKLLTEIPPPEFLSIGKFQSEISPELRKIARCMPVALF